MTSTPAAPPPASPPRRFLRAHDDRLLGGVAGGLGAAFGVDAIIFRIALGALVLAGGLGLAVYVAAMLLVPADDGTGHPAPRSATWWRLLVGSLVALGLLAGAAVVFWGAAWATAAGAGVAVAGVVIALGVVLVVASVRGERRARWLAVPAILIALPAAVVSAADVSLDGGVGERHYRPTGADRVPAEYRLGMGELVVDLRGLDWSDGRRVALKLRMGVGHAVVYVPERVCVSSRARVSAGYSGVLDRESSGFDVADDAQRTAPSGTPTLALDTSVGMGAFEVLHRASDAPDPRRARLTRADGSYETRDEANRRFAGVTGDRACRGGA